MVFSTKDKFRYHYKGHLDPTLFCADCGAGFRILKKLNLHRREIHPTPPEELLTLYEQQGKNLPPVPVPLVPTATITPQPPLFSSQTDIPAVQISQSTSDHELNAQTENYSPPSNLRIEDEDNPGTENDFTDFVEIERVRRDHQPTVRTKTKKPRVKVVFFFSLTFLSLQLRTKQRALGAVGFPDYLVF